ncbi:MAG: hypothetical protein ACOC4G_10810 [Bacillota bacterium]
MELKYKDNWKEAQQRIKAWWQGEIVDRAVVMVTAPKSDTANEEETTGSDFIQEELEDYFMNPDRVIPRMESRIKNTYWAGEAVPVGYPVSIGMVAILSNYLGCPLRFVDKNTTWSEPIIDNWEDRPDLKFNPRNKWWLKSKKLLKKAAARARGKYYIGLPDLNGPSEILSRLRREDRLAIDTLENKEEFKQALAEVNYAWYRYWQAAHGLIHQHIGGYFSMLGIYSEIQHTDLQSDFSIMISSEAYDELILPYIEQQTEWVQRTIYHLDGPGATRHLDSLLALDKLDGIQWVPGAGAPPPSGWISLLQKIQKAGKLLDISVNKEEVEILLKKLNPEGLLMKTRCDSPAEADELIQNVKKWT